MITSVATNGKAIDAAELKQRVSDRWPEILEHVAGIDSALLDGRHHPCPKCGGTDRFRLIDPAAGAVYCNQCFKQDNGDFLAAVKWMLGTDFQTACQLVADCLGYSGHARTNGYHDIVADIARLKNVPLESWKAFGAAETKRGNLEVCRVPMFDENGEQCSWMDFANNGEKKWLKGMAARKKPVGLFLAHGKLPTKGETVHIVEGPKDAAALHGLEFAAVGLPTSAMHEKFARVFRGVHVVIIPDLDKAGEAGAQKTAGRLAGVAASVRVARLPGELKESGGDDVRDVLKKRDGEKLLRQAIADAVEWKPEDDAESTATNAFPFHTATQFDQLDLRRDYHIPGILAAGAVPTILAGAFKTLKTSVVMDLLISLACHNPFLGHFPPSRRVRVAVMSGESGGFALQNLARRIASSKGWDFNQIEDWFSICIAVPNLGSAKDIEAIERFIVEREIGLLCIDPCYLAMKGLRSDEAGSLFAMGDFLEPLARLAERTGCTPLIVHHTTRSSGRQNEGKPAELADIAWSGFAEWAGQWLLLSRREKYNPDSDGEHRLWLTAGGRDGHSTLVGVDVTEGRSESQQGRRWDVEVVEAGKVRVGAAEFSQERKADKKQEQREKDRDAILDVMRLLETADTQTAIRGLAHEKHEVSSRRFDPVFDELKQEGIIVLVGQVKKSNHQSYDAFQLHPTAADHTRPGGCGPVATHTNRPPPHRGGGSDGVVLCVAETEESEPGRSDAIPKPTETARADPSRQQNGQPENPEGGSEWEL